MINPKIERRSALGVAVLSLKTPAVTSALQQAGIEYRALLVQERGGLPKMRPPVVLDTAGMDLLCLAQVLDNLAAGRIDEQKTSKLLPTIAVVGRSDYAQHRLLASCPAIVAVLAAPADPQTLLFLIHRFGTDVADSQTGPWWFDIAQPKFPSPCPDLCGLLIALAGKVKLHDAAAALNVSRATFFRRLDALCDELGLARPGRGCLADRWYQTLLNALNDPS